MSSETLLQLTNVVAGYRHGIQQTAVVGCRDWSLLEGQSWAVVGPSGSGKSTILRLLNRFEDPLEGRVSFRGTDLRALDPVQHRRRVMLVSQVPVMFAGSVEHNLRSVPRGCPAPSLDAARAALLALGLDAERLKMEASQLSVGQQQRVALARAVLRSPQVLLLDEPTASLDPQTTHQLLHALLEWTGARISFVVATHDRITAQHLGKHLALIQPGASCNELRPGVSTDELERFLGAGA